MVQVQIHVELYWRKAVRVHTRCIEDPTGIPTFNSMHEHAGNATPTEHTGPLTDQGPKVGVGWHPGLKTVWPRVDINISTLDTPSPIRRRKYDAQNSTQDRVLPDSSCDCGSIELI